MNAAIALSSTARGGLVSTAWLSKNLGADWLRVVDVRTDQAASDRASDGEDGSDSPRFVELGPRAGWLRAGRWPRSPQPPKSFLRAHIPGSTNLDVGGRLFDATGTLVWGPELAMAFSEIGVGDEHTVVLVDEGVPGPAMVAAWALRHYGHSETVVLAGGFPRWQAEGRPVTTERARHPSGSFTTRTPAA